MGMQSCAHLCFCPVPKVSDNAERTFLVPSHEIPLGGGDTPLVGKHVLQSIAFKSGPLSIRPGTRHEIFHLLALSWGSKWSPTHVGQLLGHEVVMRYPLHGKSFEPPLGVPVGQGATQGLVRSWCRTFTATVVTMLDIRPSSCSSVIANKSLLCSFHQALLVIVFDSHAP